MRYAGELLSSWGARVTSIGSAQVCVEEAPVRLRDADILLLPVRGTGDGTVLFDDGCVDLDAAFSAMSRDAIVWSGVRSPYEESVFPGYRCYQEYEAYGEEIAILTAQGVLWLLLQETPDELAAYSYDVIGNGRCGTHISKLLMRLGLSVRLIARNGAPGTMSINTWRKEPPSDVVINTVPATVIDMVCAGHWEREVVLLDIASGAIGETEEVKALPHVQFIAAEPLPGRVAPRAAGRLLAELVALEGL